MIAPPGSANVYSSAAKAFHWLTAAAVACMIPLGVYMVWRGQQTNFDATTNTLYSSHKLTGFVILWLIAARILYRALRGAPPPVSTLTKFERAASSAVHRLLYVLLLVTPLLGLAGASAFGARDIFGLFSLPQILPENERLANAVLLIHAASALTLAGLVAAHVGAALMHGLIKQDGVMNRMIGWWPLRR